MIGTRRPAPALLLALLVSGASGAAELGAGYEVTLAGKDGSETVIGSIDFSAADDGYSYRLSFDDAVFTDEFLSMRPFKCLNSPDMKVCHLVYPYEKGTRISTDNLMDLEYDLLFLFKTPTEYGINAWNGLYYKLGWTDAGLAGELREVDLNVLAAPPDEGVTRPVTYPMLHPASAEKHKYPRLTIEKR